MTGIEYPKVKIGETEYEVKFTRSVLYRMGKMGLKFSPRVSNGVMQAEFHEIVDLLHLSTGFPGTAEELAELIYDQRHELIAPVVAAWGKVVLPSINTLRPAGASAEGQAIQ